MRRNAELLTSQLPSPQASGPQPEATKYSPCRSQGRPVSQPPAAPWCSAWRFWPLAHPTPWTPAAPGGALFSPGAPPDKHTELKTKKKWPNCNNIIWGKICTAMLILLICFGIRTGRKRQLMWGKEKCEKVFKSLTFMETTHQSVLRAWECFQNFIDDPVREEGSQAQLHFTESKETRQDLAVTDIMKNCQRDSITDLTGSQRSLICVWFDWTKRKAIIASNGDEESCVDANPFMESG